MPVPVGRTARIAVGGQCFRTAWHAKPRITVGGQCFRTAWHGTASLSPEAQPGVPRETILVKVIGVQQSWVLDNEKSKRGVLTIVPALLMALVLLNLRVLRPEYARAGQTKGRA